MSKTSNVSITHLRERKTVVHAAGGLFGYHTACALDGDDDEETGMANMRDTTRRITCDQCYQLWAHFRQYKAADFSDAVRQRTP